MNTILTLLLACLPQNIDDVLTAVDEAVQAEKYDEALEGLVMAEAIAKRIRSTPRQIEIRERTSHVKEARALWERAKEAELKLSIEEDAEAHSTWGMYHAFVRKDWERGLKALSKGSNRKLADLALLDINAADPERVGDAWMGESKRSPFKEALVERAMGHYESAFRKAAGLDKLKMQKKLFALASMPVRPSKGKDARGWSFSGTATIDNAFGRDGTCSLRAQPIKDNWSGALTARLPVRDVDYTISGWCFSDGVAVGPRIGVRFWDAAGKLVGQAGVQGEADLPIWKRVESKPFRPPFGAVEMDFTVSLVVAAKSGTAWVDDVRLVAEGKQLIQNSSFEE